MSDSEVVNIASHMSALPDLALTADQMETIRLIVHGNSVIDWNRSSFRTVEDVNRFFRLHMLDPDDPEDQRRIRFVYGEAVNYLEEHLGLHFPEDCGTPRMSERSSLRPRRPVAFDAVRFRLASSSS